MKKTVSLILMLCMAQALTLRAQDTDVSGIDNVVYITPVSVDQGAAKVSLPVYMKNTAEIRGLQFDLYLPEGVTIGFNKKGKFVDEPVFNDDRLPEDDEHTIQGSIQQETGAVRFLINSQYEETFTGNEGLLFTITASLNTDMAEGDYPIIMKSIKLSENDINKSYTTDSIKSTLTVTSTTLVEGFSVNKSANGIFNLGGQPLNELQKGLNIVDDKIILVE
jgi:hypothetical protein